MLGVGKSSRCEWIPPPARPPRRAGPKQSAPKGGRASLTHHHRQSPLHPRRARRVHKTGRTLPMKTAHASCSDLCCATSSSRYPRRPPSRRTPARSVADVVSFTQSCRVWGDLGMGWVGG